jgi:hypothetical protein
MGIQREFIFDKMYKPTTYRTQDYTQIEDDDGIEDDYYDKKHVDDPENPSYIKDYKLKALRKYYRPYFSPKYDSYEMDYMKVNIDDNEDDTPDTFSIKYLFVININTKYLLVEPVYNNISIYETCKALYKITERLKPHTINNLRADADTGYGMSRIQTNIDVRQLKPHDPVELLIEYKQRNLHRLDFETFVRSLGIQNLFITKERYINRNRIVDRVIRTIRDMIGQRIDRFTDEDYVQKIVHIYNHKPHAAYHNLYTPYEVQNNPKLEAIYISYQSQRNIMVLGLQNKFMNYKQGNILLVHIPANKLSKHRRIFNAIVAFVDYVNGNALVIPLTPRNIREITPYAIYRRTITYTEAIARYNVSGINPEGSFELPVYWTKRIADSYDKLHKNYIRELYTDEYDFIDS